MPVPSNLLSSLSNPRYGTIWVPQMNRNGGINDKFAVGTRRAMSTYLSRVRLFEELDMTQLARRSSDLKKSPAKWICGANEQRNCSKGEPCCWPAPLPKSGLFFPNCSASKRVTCGLPNLNSERFLELTMWLAKNITVVHRQDWAFCKFGEIGHSWTGCTSRMRKRTPCRSLVCVAWSAGGCRCANTTCAKGYNPYCIDTLQSQLGLDGSLLAQDPVSANHSLGSEHSGFPYHMRHHVHRAVARAFQRTGPRSSSRGATASSSGLLGEKGRFARRAGNGTKAVKMAAKAAKRATRGTSVDAVADGQQRLRR